MRQIFRAALSVLSTAVLVSSLSETFPTIAQVAQPGQTGSIEGTVLLGSSSEPLAEVDVILTPQGTRGQAGNPATKTEVDGKFLIEKVPAGNYTLRIQKLGYFNTVATSTNYLITMPMTLAPQQQIKDLEFRLIQGGVIKGRVLDGNGQPLPGVPVSVLQSLYNADGNPRFAVLNMNVASTGGNPTPGAAAPATNDKGEYRLYWLNAGKYYLRADYNPKPAAPTGRPSGVVQQAITTYYPSTNDPGQAGSLTLSPGGEITADIIIRQPSSVTITGKLTETGSIPGNASRRYTLHLLPRDTRALSDRNPREVGTVTLGVGDGSFSIPFVTPGDYYLVARYLATTYGQLPVDVKGDNIEGLTLTVAPPVNVKVQVTAQGEPSAIKMDSITTMGLRPEFFDTPWSTTRIAADGSGEVTNMAQGRYVFQSLALPGDSYIADVRQGPRSMMREIITIGANSEPLQVTVNTGGGRVEGNVRDAAGKALPALVVLTPLNRQRIPLYLTNFRAAAEASGHFTVGNLPPGDYKVFAFESIPSGADMNPEFMATVDALGTRVTVPQGGRLNLDLRRISRETTNR